MEDSEQDADKILFHELIAVSKADADAQDPLVDIIMDILEWECTMNDKELTSPGISVRAYLERIKCFSGASSCCFVLGVFYLETMRGLDTAYKINSYNFHRLMLTAVMVAAKFVDDFYFSNNYWAKVGGIPNDELNGLELEFLFLTNFNLHIKRADYDAFAKELRRRQQHIKEQQASKTMHVLTVPTSQISVRS